MERHSTVILVVDDEPALRDIFSGWLRSMDYGEVLTAADGIEALATIESRDIGLLVTDVRMPIMDGVTLVKRLTERARVPSIVFVSALSDVDEREMYALGVTSFLAKPLAKEDLVEAVEHTLTAREELWNKHPVRAPRQSIVIGDTEEGTPAYKLGRGGFCAHFTGQVALGKVRFECRGADRATVMLMGEGVLRWRSRSEGLIGVEFTYLDDSSRAYVLSTLGVSEPLSYIPNHF